MPRARLTKSAIDALPVPLADLVYWDETLPGFGVKVTPAGRKVFIVLYRTSGAGSRLRKYTIGPYGRVTLHVARNEAQRILAARTEGRDPASEKREARRRLVADRVDDLVTAFVKQHVSKRRSSGEISRILKREIVARWGARSIHEITRRDIIELVTEIVDRGTPVAANKILKVAKTFFGWCVGKAILDRSPCEGVNPPTREVARDRILTDDELARVIKAARQIGGPYGGIVELLALTAQRREEVAQMTWDELDVDKCVWTLPGARTKNGKPHIVHLSEPAMRVITARPKTAAYVFTTGQKPFSGFSIPKPELDRQAQVSGWRLHDLRRTAVSGMARLGVPPHVADKILNHTAGTISGWPLCISGMSSWPSANRLWTLGRATSRNSYRVGESPTLFTGVPARFSRSTVSNPLAGGSTGTVLVGSNAPTHSTASFKRLERARHLVISSGSFPRLARLLKRQPLRRKCRVTTRSVALQNVTTWPSSRRRSS